MDRSRREFGKLTLTALPASWVLARVPLSAFAAIDSKIKGVQIGAITYSFRTIPNADDIIKAYQTIGIGEMELMSNHAEALAGAPPGPGGPGDRAAVAAAPGRRTRGAHARATGGARRRDQSAARLADGRVGGDVRAGAQEDRGRRHRAAPALLQHERPARRRTTRSSTRFMMAEVARRQGDLDVDAGQHGEAPGAVRRQAQDAGRLPRPRQHHRSR